jgi:hypothetical protein
MEYSIIQTWSKNLQYLQRIIKYRYLKRSIRYTDDPKGTCIYMKKVKIIQILMANIYKDHNKTKL